MLTIYQVTFLYKKISRRTMIGFPAVLFIILNPAPMRKLRRQI